MFKALCLGVQDRRPTTQLPSRLPIFTVGNPALETVNFQIRRRLAGSGPIGNCRTVAGRGAALRLANGSLAVSCRDEFTQREAHMRSATRQER